jgi:hypothetical protein
LFPEAMPARWLLPSLPLRSISKRFWSWYFWEEMGEVNLMENAIIDERQKKLFFSRQSGVENSTKKKSF